MGGGDYGKPERSFPFPGVKLFTCLPADPETQAKLPALADPDHRFGPVGAEAVAGVF